MEASHRYNRAMGHIDRVVGPHSEGVLEQLVDDEMIVFSPDAETYFTLNRSAREVWELADGTKSIGEITIELARRYEVEPDSLLQDVTNIVASFADGSLI